MQMLKEKYHLFALDASKMVLKFCITWSSGKRVVIKLLAS